ncbi:hypothetical protein SAMN04488511_11984 [Pedobacter suwonensis]|uniref:Uncharacterized protein n=1 Tax=Pedobacter suwonensis TaxID=332999 RepID=A0A1I0U3D8_9SPHI|nr:hypothetical protein [Pedobacter suwonensis]SFA58518.1 hypothetical protein SAMN04488511_11984 [Pedobacter suwonensis]
MNKYTTFFKIVCVAIVLVITNTDRAKHSIAVEEILTKECSKAITEEIRESKNNYQATSAGIGLLLASSLIDK